MPKINKLDDLNDSARDELLKSKRVDSLSEKDIYKLQNVTKPGPYIIDEAHEYYVHVLHTYDQVNGTVLNANKRHELIKRLVMRDPTSQLTNHKLAKSELTKTLSKLAVDNKTKLSIQKELAAKENSHPLKQYNLATAKLGVELAKTANLLEKNHLDYKLADHCLKYLEAESVVKKEAAAASTLLFMPWYVTVGIAAAGILYWTTHSTSLSSINSIDRNGEALIKEIDAMIDSDASVDWFTDTYKQPYINGLQVTKSHVDNIIRAWKKINSIVSNYRSDPDFKNKVVRDQAFAQKVRNDDHQIEVFTNALAADINELVNESNILLDTKSQEDMVENRSSWSSGVDTVNKWLGGWGIGGWGFLSNKPTSLGRDLLAFVGMCKVMAGDIRKYLGVKKDAQKNNPLPPQETQETQEAASTTPEAAAPTKPVEEKSPLKDPKSIPTFST